MRNLVFILLMFVSFGVYSQSLRVTDFPETNTLPNHSWTIVEKSGVTYKFDLSVVTPGACCLWGSNLKKLFPIYSTDSVVIGGFVPHNKFSVVGNSDFSGNVGIGTTSPTAKLDVNGTASFKDSIKLGNRWLKDTIDIPIHIKVHLTAAQIQTANSIPILVPLPASGIGYYWRVTAFDCKLNYGTIIFTSTLLSIYSTTQSGNAPNLINSCLSSNLSFIFQSDYPVGGNFTENDTLSISADVDSATGDSTVDCYIQCVKVKL